MSEAARLIQQVKEIRARLYNPPNAKLDDGVYYRRGNASVAPKLELVVNISQVQQRLPPKIGMITIIHYVSEYFSIGVMDLKNDSRLHRFAIPRQIAMLLMRRWTRASLEQIGREVRKHHTTVMHGINAIERRRVKVPHVQEAIDELERRLGRA